MTTYNSDMPIYLTSELIDEFFKVCMLGDVAKTVDGRARLMRCRKCGKSLGCVETSRGIVFGNFVKREDDWSQLVGAGTICERTISIKCACGYVTRWRKPK